LDDSSYQQLITPQVWPLFYRRKIDSDEGQQKILPNTQSVMKNEEEGDEAITQEPGDGARAKYQC